MRAHKRPPDPCSYARAEPKLLDASGGWWTCAWRELPDKGRFSGFPCAVSNQLRTRKASEHEGARRENVPKFVFKSKFPGAHEHRDRPQLVREETQKIQIPLQLHSKSLRARGSRGARRCRSPSRPPAWRRCRSTGTTCRGPGGAWGVDASLRTRFGLTPRCAWVQSSSSQSLSQLLRVFLLHLM